MNSDDEIHLTVAGPPPVDVTLERDRNGCPVERRSIDGGQVVVHYDDVPECDLTVIDGIRCTTAVRTIIDLAPDLCAGELDELIQDAIARGIVASSELIGRASADDMAHRRGARLVRRSLHRLRLH